MSKHIVAALQIGSDLIEGKAKTLEKIMSYEQAIIDSKAELVVMPEALLGGYPKGEIFGAYLGYRLPEGRADFAAYYENAIDVPGPECEELAALSARTGASLVVGCIEKTPHALYCSALFFDPESGLAAKHRKLLPTASERLVWGMGDGSTLPVVQTKAGKVGACICWENHMPLLRSYMYAKGVEVYCAPTVDCRDQWQHSMKHIAHEGRCFVVTAVQYLPSPEALGKTVPHWKDDEELMRGGSVIVDPMGQVLAGPLYHKEGLVSAEIDLEDIVKAKYDMDVSSHYARPDVFSLHVDTRPKKTVVETVVTEVISK
ncbi:carbon-nitrogen hydrolase family protein [Parasutterella muris]|uniref:carbon-nitrogen hydrolase family protein n=1 Tax=Parasutterella muris TaxID=2565572 RepID=UPI00203B532E|nr:carbon-nitrogen hydrolase family protein [Parasutterella muris]